MQAGEISLEQEMVLSSQEEQKAPSPFIEGTKIQYAWDSTSLGWLKTCPRLYQYKMIEGWRSKHESVHLRFGIEFHFALQDYDVSQASGIPHDDAVFDVVRALLIRTFGWKSDHQKKNRETLVRSVIWYLEEYKDDAAKTFVMDNGKAAVEVSFRFVLNYGPLTDTLIAMNMPYEAQRYVLCGHLDRIVSFCDNVFVKDNKTTSAAWFTNFEPHNQMTFYTLAGQIVLHSPVKGVIIDISEVQINYTKFSRELTYRTPDQIEEWLNDLEYWLRMSEGYAIKGYWPQNDTACGMYGGCEFREVCSKSPQVREIFLKSDFTKEKSWNPLQTR